MQQKLIFSRRSHHLIVYNVGQQCLLPPPVNSRRACGKRHSFSRRSDGPTPTSLFTTSGNSASSLPYIPLARVAKRHLFSRRSHGSTPTSSLFTTSGNSASPLPSTISAAFMARTLIFMACTPHTSWVPAFYSRSSTPLPTLGGKARNLSPFILLRLPSYVIFLLPVV